MKRSKRIAEYMKQDRAWLEYWVDMECKGVAMVNSNLYERLRQAWYFGYAQGKECR